MKQYTNNTRIKKNNKITPNEYQLEEAKIKEFFRFIRQQQWINKWNTEYVGKLNRNGKPFANFFESQQFEGDAIIVQTYLENKIKELAFDDNGKIIGHTSYVSQIDARLRTTDTPKWVDNPMPILEKGIILAISADNMLYYAEQAKKFKELYPNKEYIIPKVGDTVYLRPFNAREFRYYTDKQERLKDMVRTQTEWHLNEFDFLFSVNKFDIESIVPSEVAGLLSDDQSQYPYLDFINQLNSDNIANYFGATKDAYDDNSDDIEPQTSEVVDPLA